MSIPRLHAEGPLIEGAELALTPGQAHHIGTVLRRAAGAELRVFNAAEGEFAATLIALKRDRGALRLVARLRPPEAEPELRLLIAALKREAMDWAIEKATELGVTRIVPVLTRRCVATSVNVERLAAIVRAAAEQCERLSLPDVLPARPLHAVLDGWDGARLLVAAERREAAPLHLLASTAHALLTGPEGGFDRAELDDLARRPFVSLASLGPRILRAETAVVAGLGAISFAQAAHGDESGTKASL